MSSVTKFSTDFQLVGAKERHLQLIPQPELIELCDECDGYGHVQLDGDDARPCWTCEQKGLLTFSAITGWSYAEAV